MKSTGIRLISITLVLGGIVAIIAALGIFPQTKEEGNGVKFSVETTTIARLMDTPCTHELFVEKLGAGELFNNPQFNIVRHLTMRRLSKFPLADLDEQKLRAIQSEFSKLDPQSPNCQISASSVQN